jgi:carboxylesterase
MQRVSVVGFIGSILYLILFWLTDFEFFGTWPAILGILSSVATIIWRTARKEDDLDDGASL